MQPSGRTPPPANPRPPRVLIADDNTQGAELLEAYLTSQPHGDFSDRALGQLAVCQLHSGDNEKAAATFDRLLERLPAGPAAAEAAWNRGQVLERLNRFDAAIASYQLIIDKQASSDRFEDALLATARLHSKLQQHLQAVELYQRFLRERSASAQIDAARYGLAWALRDVGKRPESDEQFQKLHDAFRSSRFWNDATYLASFRTTAVFSVLVAGLGIGISLLLATMADRVVRGALA